MFRYERTFLYNNNVMSVHLFCMCYSVFLTSVIICIFSVFQQGETGEAGNPGSPGEPGIGVSTIHLILDSICYIQYVEY